MASVDFPDITNDHRRPFRALEESNPVSRWNRRAAAEVEGDDPGETLIGGDQRGPSPRATVTLIGAGGSPIRGGTLIGSGGTRAPLDPDPPSGSGGAPSPRRRATDADAGAWDDAGAAMTLDDELLAGLAADRDRLTEIARALGACPDCWGERIGCPRCGGIGRPGSDEPGADAFDWYVRPLLNRLAATPPTRRPRPPGSEDHPAGRGPDVNPR